MPVRKVVAVLIQSESVAYTNENKYKKKKVGMLVESGGLSLAIMAGMSAIENTMDPVVRT